MFNQIPNNQMNQMQMSQIPMGYQMPNFGNIPQMAMNNMQNQQMMMNNLQNTQMMMNNNNQSQLYTRLKEEFDLCTQDNDLVQIGCNFGLVNNNIYLWLITMVGPKNTPYEGGLFKIQALFPFDYPNHGPELRFLNKIYHLNVDCVKEKDGHICINSINSWRTSGQVAGHPFYTMKQALFDIFCLFYNQGVDSAFDENMADLYKNNRDKFNEEARKWTQSYAPMA